jgi:hypothetical protein
MAENRSLVSVEVLQTAAVNSSYSGSVEVEEVRAIMRSLQDLYVEGPRAALISRDGYHRPYTRGGGCKSLSFCLHAACGPACFCC